MIIISATMEFTFFKPLVKIVSCHKSHPIMRPNDYEKTGLYVIRVMLDASIFNHTQKFNRFETPRTEFLCFVFCTSQQHNSALKRIQN